MKCVKLRKLYVKNVVVVFQWLNIERKQNKINQEKNKTKRRSDKRKEKVDIIE